MSIRTQTNPRSTSSRQGLRRDTLLVIVVAVSAALPFLLAPLRAQVLGPAGRGEFAFFQSALTTVGMASALGLRVACYQVGFVGNDRFYVSYLKLGVASIFASAVVLVPLVWVSATQFSPIVTISIAALVVLAPSFAMNQIEFASASFQQNRYRIGQATAVPAIVEFGSSLVAFTLNSYTLILGVVVAVGAQSQRLATAWVWHLKDRSHAASGAKTFTARIEVEKALLRASLKNAPAVVVPLLSGNLDVFIIGMLATTDVLGQYAVAKLGFSALLIAASIFEGRAISIVSNRGRKTGVFVIIMLSAALAVLGGAAGWLLTPMIFGQEFAASAHAFPVLSAAGGLSFIFICISAVNAHRRRASIWPAVLVLAVLVGMCLMLSRAFPYDIVMISYALVVAQALGCVLVLIHFFSNKGRHL